MTPSMDNFTPDPSYCVDIDPITWETSICKYTEHGKQCIESFLEPDIKASFYGFASLWSLPFPTPIRGEGK